MRGATINNEQGQACTRDDSDLISDDQSKPKAAEVKALIDVGYETHHAKAIAADDNCTLQQIAIGIEVTKHYEQRAKRRNKPFDFLRYLRCAIVHKYPPLPTSEQRQRSRLPEHHQEQLAASSERRNVAASLKDCSAMCGFESRPDYSPLRIAPRIFIRGVSGGGEKLGNRSTAFDSQSKGHYPVIVQPRRRRIGNGASGPHFVFKAI